ncbi:MAG: hypothetical protein JSV66_17640 [Trueperaceae bacterium]|nr:MAG: hypothetical protein JSV66_17640 [Trueperaceae bacterium]
MATEQQKVTVTLPKALLERLDDAVPKRKRSRFITEAIREHLDLIEQKATLDEAAGSWSDANHPDMQTEAAMDEWLKTLRQSWR